MKSVKYLSAFCLLFVSCHRDKPGTEKAAAAQKQIKVITESIHEPVELEGRLSHQPKILAHSFVVKSIFNPKGDLLKEEQYNDHGNLEWQKIYAYDEERRLLEMTLYHFKEMSRRRINKYDKEKRLIEYNEFDNDRKNISRKVIRTDSNGHERVSEYVLTRGVLVKTSEELFDQNKNNIRNFYFSDGRLAAKEENQYDNQGNRVESIWSDMSNNSQRITHVKYDDKHNAIETGILDGNLMMESKTITRYNDQDQVMERLTYGIKGNLKERIQHYYEYDEWGQWVKDVTVINKKPFSVRIRKLEYF